MPRLPLLTAAVAALALPAAAQTVLDLASLRQIDDLEVRASDGSDLGEVEDVLIGPDGMPVAVVVEVGGRLGFGEEDVVIPFERMTFADGAYLTDLDQAGIEALPRYDD